MTDKYNITQEDQQLILDARDFGFETANILNKALKEISDNAANESIHIQEDWDWKLKFITQTFFGSVQKAKDSNVRMKKYLLWLERQQNVDDKMEEAKETTIKNNCRLGFSKEVSEVLQKTYQEYTGSVFVPYVKSETDKQKTKNERILEVHNKKMVNYITDLNKVLEGDKVSYQPKHSIEDLTDAVQTS